MRRLVLAVPAVAALTVAPGTAPAAEPEPRGRLCGSTSVRVTTTSGVRAFYWDDYAERWSPTPEVGCHRWNQEPEQVELDPLLCAVLAYLAPPEGDPALPVAGTFWDCPPYAV